MKQTFDCLPGRRRRFDVSVSIWPAPFQNVFISDFIRPDPGELEHFRVAFYEVDEKLHRDMRQAGRQAASIRGGGGFICKSLENL